MHWRKPGATRHTQRKLLENQLPNSLRVYTTIIMCLFILQCILDCITKEYDVVSTFLIQSANKVKFIDKLTQYAPPCTSDRQTFR